MPRRVRQLHQCDGTPYRSNIVARLPRCSTVLDEMEVITVLVLRESIHYSRRYATQHIFAFLLEVTLIFDLLASKLLCQLK